MSSNFVSAHAFRVALCCACLLAGACPSSSSEAHGDAGGSDAGGSNAADGGADRGSGGVSGTGGGASGTGGGASGTGGGASGTGGGTVDAGMAKTGPGINDDGGDMYCLNDQPALAAAFYFGVQTACSIFDKKEGTFTTDEAKNWDYLCTGNMGVVVSECPASDRVAYCDGDAILGLGTVRETRIIYKTTVNPDAATIARDLLGVCSTLPAFDASDDHMLSAQCTGTFKAKVDGKDVDFSVKPTCIFKTDGTNMVFFVSAYDDPKAADAKGLTLYVLKKGSTFLLQDPLGQAGYGYSEGGAASGAFATPAAGSMPTYTSKTFDMNGASISGSFELGTLTGGGGATRTITAGEIDLTFDVQ